MTTPFYDDPRPIAAFVRTFQKFVGAPQTGMWDRTTHDAVNSYFTRVIAPLLRVADAESETTGVGYSIPDSLLGPWGVARIPDVGSVVVRMVNPHDMPETVQALFQTLRADLGVAVDPPDMATRAKVEGTAMKVAEYITGVEAGRVDPKTSGASSGGGSNVGKYLLYGGLGLVAVIAVVLIARSRSKGGEG